MSPVLLFCFNDTAPTEIYTLSLHDALPISCLLEASPDGYWMSESGAYDAMVGEMVDSSSDALFALSARIPAPVDRKSTRLNSSHTVISYAVFCLKKKTTQRR